MLVLLLATVCQSCEKPGSAPQIYSETVWQNDYGGGDNDEASKAIFHNGNLVICGSTRSFGNANGSIFLLRIDTLGEIVSQRSIGNSAIYEGKGINLLRDGNFLISGTVEDLGSENQDLVVFKTDPQGNELWSLRTGGPGEERCGEVLELSNGQLLLVGTTDSEGAGGRDMMLSWIAQEGELIKQSTYGGALSDGADSVIELDEGELMIYGYTYSFGAGDRDLFLLQISAAGDSIWSASYGSANYEESGAIGQTIDGGYILLGHSSNTDPNHNVLAYRLDDRGIVIWKKEFGGSEHDGGQALHVKPEGGFTFVARTNSSGAGQEDILLIEVDDYGNTISERTFGGTENDRSDCLLRLEQDYYIIGSSRSYTAGDKQILVIRYSNAS